MASIGRVWQGRAQVDSAVDGILTGTQRHAAGIELNAGPDVTVASGADVTFRAGERVVISGEFTIETGVTFVAENEAELGGVAVELDYMHARYCSPELGRFLSVDPGTRGKATKSPQRWNLYAYAAGNPLKYVDPDGEALSIVYDFSGSGLTQAEQNRLVQGVRQVFRGAGVRNVVSLFRGSSIKPLSRGPFDRTVSVKVTARSLGDSKLGKTPLIPGNRSMISTAPSPASDPARTNQLINTTAHEVGHASGALAKYSGDAYEPGTLMNPLGSGAEAGTIMEQGVPVETLGVAVRSFSEEDAERLRLRLNEEEELRPPN